MKELNENTLKNYKSGPLYARVRDLLIDYIAELPPEKEYLPYEYEMEESLKVSRQSIRHALQELRSAGMLETVRNRGSRSCGNRSDTLFRFCLFRRPEDCQRNSAGHKHCKSEKAESRHIFLRSHNLRSFPDYFMLIHTACGNGPSVPDAETGGMLPRT